MTIPAYFWTHVDKTEGCWTWTSSISPDGYGRAGTHQSHGTSLPHRVTWAEENGPIPNGLELDHLCNNRACVRPDHLEAVTHQENIRRAVDRRTTCPNGHPTTPENRVSHYDVADGNRCLPCRRKANRESIRRQRARKIPVDQIVPWDVRVWAWANGYPCKVKGPIARSVVAAYLESEAAA